MISLGLGVDRVIRGALKHRTLRDYPSFSRTLDTLECRVLSSCHRLAEYVSFDSFGVYVGTEYGVLRTFQRCQGLAA